MSKKLNKNISMLRFPEFAGKWEIKKLGDICDCIVPGRNKPKTFDGNIPWITIPDIEHGRINVFSASLKISYEEAQSIGSKVVPKGSVLMSCVGELGITAITDCEIVINQQLHAFIPSDLINKYFLFYGIKTQKKYIESIATKTAVPYLNKNNCNSISIPLPSIAEQEKIASFLGAIDTRLTQLRRKHELLQTYKRGVMQKIFSQEVRFKGAINSNFPDWEEKRLNQLLFEHKNRNYDLSFSKEDVLSVSGDVGIINQIQHLGRSYAGESVANYHVVYTGDIVYTKSPLKSNPYGIIKANKGKPGIVSTLYAVYSCKQRVLPDYLNYYFSIDDNVNGYLRPLVQKGAKNDMKINNQRVLIDSITIPSFAILRTVF